MSSEPAGTPVFSVNYFCRLASAIFAGSGRRGSRSITMMPVGRVGGACAVQAGWKTRCLDGDTLPQCSCAFSMPLARSTGCSAAGRPGMFTRSTGGGLRATADREHARGEQAPAAISAGSGPFGSLARWKWQPARELAGRADRRLQPRGRRVRSVGTLPNPGRPPRPVSRRGRPGRRRPGRDRKAHNCHLSRGTDGVSPEGP